MKCRRVQCCLLTLSSLCLVQGFQPSQQLFMPRKQAVKNRPQQQALRRTMKVRHGNSLFRAKQPLPSSSSLLAASLATVPITPRPFLSAWYMALLALQFGAQPILTRSFTPKSICRSTVVLVQEIVKFAMAAMVLFFTGSWSQSLQNWSVASWWLVAGVPAALYVVQNYCSLVAYQNLPAVTFNVLNQTKTLSAALCCYFVMGRVQSKIQIASLLLLLGSALVLEKVIPLGRKQASPQPVAAEKEEEEEQDEEQKAESLRTHLRGGVLPVLVASFTSGLAGALTQKSLQQQGRNSYLLTMELSTASLLVLLVSLLKSPDGDRLKRDGFWNGWTAKTWLPVATNAAGGVLVGLVTKYSGSVRKGFALILGLFLSGVFQATWSSSEDNDSNNNNDNDFVLTREQIVGGTLAAFSLWMHSSFPASSSCGGGR